MKFIGADTVNQLIQPQQLVDKLQQAFAGDTTTPLRQHFDIPNPFAERETTLLMMPSWQDGKDIGIKLVTVAPENAKYDLPSIQGVYVLMDALKGHVKAMIDAPSITAKRTAAASALASRFVSRQDSNHLLMVGTGTLSPELIRAHSAVRPINRVTVYGRSEAKAEAVKAQLTDLDIDVAISTDIQASIGDADIISCATLSKEPLIQGAWLKPGQHLDMVGAYRPDMREADDDCVRRARIIVDNYTGACKETGDIKTPLDTGIISKDDLEADLFELCKQQKRFERQVDDITLFKSVGHALEDLAAAQLLTSLLGEDELVR